MTEGDPTPVAPRSSGRNPDAYEDCLKGRYFLDTMCQEEIYKAIAFFKSAVADETCCSLGHAGIADAYCQLALLGSAPASQLDRQARSSAEIALKNDPGLADAHVSSGRVKMIFDWDWKGAQDAGRRAAAFDPCSVSAQIFQASLLCIFSSYEEAKQICYQVLATAPLFFAANVQLAACLYGACDFQGSADQCWKILTLAPRFAPAQILLALA
ncbi:MAG TPA: hypothetical protein VG168_15255, partial [Bryobacteraceae bacterium]|nr:hypothetical protein [Bryobacteraceae bacterium]